MGQWIQGKLINHKTLGDTSLMMCVSGMFRPSSDRLYYDNPSSILVCNQCFIWTSWFKLLYSVRNLPEKLACPDDTMTKCMMLNSGGSAKKLLALTNICLSRATGQTEIFRALYPVYYMEEHLNRPWHLSYWN